MAQWIAFDRADPKISASARTSRETRALYLNRQTIISVYKRLSVLIFSTDTVCALWPIWSSGVVQGSLRLSGGGLMVHRLSLCACYSVCIACACTPAARSLSFWLILSHCVVEGWCLKWQIIHQAIMAPQYWVGFYTNGLLFSFVFYYCSHRPL